MSKSWKQIRKPRWETVLSVGGLAVVLALVGYGLYRGRDMLLEYDWRVSVPLLGLSFLVYPAGLALRLVGWHQVMSMLHPGLTFRTNARIYCLTSLTRFVPGVIWYMVGRAELYKSVGPSRSSVVAGSVVEAVLLVVTGFLTYLMSLPFSPMAAALSEYLPVAMVLITLAEALFCSTRPCWAASCVSAWGVGATV
jgi:hypothetical protein